LEIGNWRLEEGWRRGLEEHLQLDLIAQRNSVLADQRNFGL
jgi:hypothetical protein